MVFRDTIAPLAGAQVDWAEVGRQQRGAAWFVGWLLLPLAALTLLARDGMPQYRGLILVGICVTAVALYLPFHLTRLLSSEKSRALWFGPLVILSGFAALAATYLGSIGAYVLSAMAAAVVLPKIAKSLFPAAEAGLAMIQGYAPKQSDCPQEIALARLRPAGDVRSEEMEQSICMRAHDKGSNKVAWFDTLSVRDAKLLGCAGAP